MGIGVIRLIRLFILHRAVNKWSCARGSRYGMSCVSCSRGFSGNGATFSSSSSSSSSFCFGHLPDYLREVFFPLFPLAALLWLCIAADLPLLLDFQKV